MEKHITEQLNWPEKETAKERAIEIVQHMRTNLDIPTHLQDGLVARITIALKDQDKITRHACAEAINIFSDEEIVGSSVIFSGEAKVCNNFRDKACQAIMNTKAI